MGSFSTGAWRIVPILLLVVLSQDPASIGMVSLVKILIGCASGQSEWCDAFVIPRFAFSLIDEASAKFTDTAEVVADRHVAGQGLKGKVAIVTGASSGIGVETTRVLLAKGCDVVLAVRTVSKGERVLRQLQSELDGNAGTGTVMHLDLSDLDSVRAFSTSFVALGRPLHYLVANAGVMGFPTKRLSAQGHELQFGTNHLGHFLLVRLLESRVLESGTAADPARVVVVSSSAGEAWQNLPGSPEAPAARLALQIPPTLAYDPLMNYILAKSLNVMTALGFQQRFGETAVAVSLHPGIIKTGLLSHGASGLFEDAFFGWFFTPVHKSMEQGASTTLHALLSPDVVDEVRAGPKFYKNNAPKLVSGSVLADGVVEEAFRLSEALVQDWL